MAVADTPSIRTRTHDSTTHLLQCADLDARLDDRPVAVGDLAVNGRVARVAGATWE